MHSKKIAFVVQRYGYEINGGAEQHVRMLAYKLAPFHDITVLTTCALDPRTWASGYPPGPADIKGIHVIRFPNQLAASRGKLRYIRRKLKHKLLSQVLVRLPLIGTLAKYIWPNTTPDYNDFRLWLERQGPYSPELISYIEQHQQEYDVFIFITALFHPTAIGVTIAPHKSILIPTAHDEKPMYYPGYETVFQSAEWLVYNSQEEKDFCEQLYKVSAKKNNIVGIGLPPPTNILSPEELLPKFKITSDYIIYVGRIDKKKCGPLFEYFQKFKQTWKQPLQLVVVGKSFMPLPQDPDIIYTGFISDEEKNSLIAHTKVLIMPSRYESLSLITLEAMAMGKPVIVNGECLVLKEHIDKSDAGYFYCNYTDFAQQLQTLLTQPGIYTTMGEKGKQYVTANYSWPIIIEKMNTAIAAIGQ